MYGVREVSISGIGVNNEVAMMSESKGNNSEVAKANMPWKTESNDGCFLQGSAQVEAYHSFLDAISEPVKTEGMQMGHHRQHNEFHCGFLEGQGSECLVGDRPGSDMGSPGPRVVVRGLKEDPCSLKAELDILPVEVPHGERRQKKRDQNKTAAHRYDEHLNISTSSMYTTLYGTKLFRRYPKTGGPL